MGCWAVCEMVCTTEPNDGYNSSAGIGFEMLPLERNGFCWTHYDKIAQPFPILLKDTLTEKNMKCISVSKRKNQTAAHWITAFNCTRRPELVLEDILPSLTLMRLTLCTLLKAVNQPLPHLVVSSWKFVVLEVSIELRSSWYSCIFRGHLWRLLF